MTPDRFPSFCPKLGEFKSLCRLAPEPKSFPAPRLSDLSKSAQSPVAREALAELKKLVGIKTGD